MIIGFRNISYSIKQVRLRNMVKPLVGSAAHFTISVIYIYGFSFIIISALFAQWNFFLSSFDVQHRRIVTGLWLQAIHAKSERICYARFVRIST